MSELIHRHEYSSCCEHADHLNSRLDFLEMLVTPPPPPEEEIVVAEPAADTGDDAGEEPTPVDIDIDIDVHAEGGSDEEESSHEEEHESDHEDDEEEEPPDGEVVIGDDSGLPELSEGEKSEQRAHSLPMMRS